MTTVAVDFDKVIHAYSRGWADGSIYDDPVPGAFKAMAALTGAGVAVYVHTTRNPEETAGWLRSHGVTALSERELAAHGEPVGEFWNHTDLILVTTRKLPAVAFVDDRAIRFYSWPQALADLHVYEGIDVTAQARTT